MEQHDGSMKETRTLCVYIINDILFIESICAGYFSSSFFSLQINNSLCLVWNHENKAYK